MKLSCRVEPKDRTYYVEMSLHEKNLLTSLLMTIDVSDQAIKTAVEFVQTELMAIPDPHDRPNEVADRLTAYLTDYAQTIRMINDLKSLDRL